MKVLISGCGIAGPTLAYWLARYGSVPTIVEHAPALRTGGYVVDFWGAGYEVAGRMGVLEEIRRHGYTVQKLRTVDRRGRTIAEIPAQNFALAAGGGFTSVPRGELSAILYESLDGQVETIFGDAIAEITQTPAAVEVAFERGAPRTFDLVVGADGLHSRVRQIVFGPAERFERYLGIKVAAFAVDGYRPRDELTYVMHPEVGRQAARFSMRGDRTMFLLTFEDGVRELPADLESQKAALRREFGRSGWECRQILDAMEPVHDLYFDRVSQIEMNSPDRRWSRGRATLVGDAAFCISLLGGQGSALAMAAAYVLAGELKNAGGDVAAALGRYERLFAPFVAGKQRAARRFAGAFAPKSALRLFLGNQLFRLLANPIVARLTAGRTLSDRIELPAY